ncbi:c-type cytochrome [Yoonia vestfoldensis]|uniref:c-type cytochrome n=1 Tax=Yoonia vestfoldensis TaxID=245188 RepID=UPI0003619E59|nr:c-type cytochrome [Yoonia vestfoldensis]
MTFLLFAGMISSTAFAQEGAPQVALSCAGCHGQAGEGAGSIARIAGYDRDAFITVWEEFRNNERPATIMNRIAPGYTPEDVAILADYFASIE